MGCGSGDMLAAIRSAWEEKSSGRNWEGCGCGNLVETGRIRMAEIECCGIDINPDNIEAALEKNIPGLLLGDAEDIETLLPPEMMFEVVIFCGLLNRQVTTREKALRILMKTLPQLRSNGHIIVTGYTSCHFSAADLAGMGMTVLRKSIPENIFKDYQNYSLRQLYAARKM